MKYIIFVLFLVFTTIGVNAQIIKEFENVTYSTEYLHEYKRGDFSIETLTSGDIYYVVNSQHYVDYINDQLVIKIKGKKGVGHIHTGQLGLALSDMTNLLGSVSFNFKTKDSVAFYTGDRIDYISDDNLYLITIRDSAEEFYYCDIIKRGFFGFFKYNRSGFIAKKDIHEYLVNQNDLFLVRNGEIYRMSYTKQSQRNPLIY